MAKSRRTPKRQVQAARPDTVDDAQELPLLQAEADQVSETSLDQEDVDVYALEQSDDEGLSEEESDDGRLGEREIITQAPLQCLRLVSLGVPSLDAGGCSQTSGAPATRKAAAGRSGRK